MPLVPAGVLLIFSLNATKRTSVTFFAIFFLFARTYSAVALDLRNHLVGIAHHTLPLPTLLPHRRFHTTPCTHFTSRARRGAGARRRRAGEARCGDERAC